uniref:Uncharacterized protein n=1 Tax=Anguilla anguilla TaxID=7936 RepID=A0A0E9U489_ANGAN
MYMILGKRHLASRNCIIFQMENLVGLQQLLTLADGSPRFTSSAKACGTVV